MKKLSLIIPAHNEEDVIENTVRSFNSALEREAIPHEILVVIDNCSDQTDAITEKIKKDIPELRTVKNAPPNGFGRAIRCGLENHHGDYIAIVMADMSDSPEDLIKFYRKAEEGYDAVFGSRFSHAGKTIDYPWFKYICNRIGNFIISILFGMRYNDTTNAFKLYSKETLEGLRPFLAYEFNLTVELPLKTIVRGYSYTVIPNSWTNREAGKSKFSLKIREAGSRYFFIILYCLLEKWLSRGDYMKKTK